MGTDIRKQEERQDSTLNKVKSSCWGCGMCVVRESRLAMGCNLKMFYFLAIFPPVWDIVGLASDVMQALCSGLHYLVSQKTNSSQWDRGIMFFYFNVIK